MGLSIKTVHAGLFKLDGGAMFGIVPKRLWSRMIEADDNNLCTWAMRCLLIETDERKILVDTGMGIKQGEKFRSHFEPHGPFSLDESLAEVSIKPEEITDVLITHLHFDHVGGAVKYDSAQNLVPSFPNAKYWIHHGHYEWALEPNYREKASFLKENFVPLVEHGVVEFLDFDKSQDWLEGIELRIANGHTRQLMYPVIPYNNSKLFYPSDLMPSSYHIGMPYIMSYDLQPLVTLQEKKALLEEVYESKALMYYEHDALIECSHIELSSKGRFIKGEGLELQDV